MFALLAGRQLEEFVTEPNTGPTGR